MFCPDCGLLNEDSAKRCAACGCQVAGEDRRATAQKGLLPGTMLQGRYEVQKTLKSGGMGALYVVLDRRLEATCALKEMRDANLDSRERSEASERFRREAGILSALRHPQLPAALDHFEESGHFYLVMDFVTGEDLETLLARNHGRLHEKQVRKISCEILDILQYLHNQKPPVIHRDVKPSNIMIRESDGAAVLIDFGIARTVRSQATRKTQIGTQGYAPKEQYLGNPEPRSDLYALGATMHHLLTGKEPLVPFSFEPVRTLRGGISQDLELVIARALQMNPEDRFSSAFEMKEALMGRSSSLDSSRPSKKPKGVPPPPLPPLQEFEFHRVTVTIRGDILEQSCGQAQSFFEDLGGGAVVEMVLVPGGTFMMGSPNTEEGREDYEDPQHEVVTRPFFVAKFPITREQWEAVIRLPQVNRPLQGDPQDSNLARHPVQCVSWYDTVEFCERLARKTRRPYRLPSEAEWEYACRAETWTPFHSGETITPDLANYDEDSPYGKVPRESFREGTTPVALPGGANGFGLFDMHGNVWEWCADPWHPNYIGAPADGSVWEMGGAYRYRVLRGGSWLSAARQCRSASRARHEPVDRYSDVGFRVVLSSSV